MGAVLVVGILVIYAPVRRFPFISFDDPQYVTDNPAVEGGVTAAGIVWAFASPHAANWHPLTWLSHMLDVQLFGLDAGAHHVTNVLVHLVNALLLLGLLRTLTGEPGPSAFVAMVFAFHPLRVESVAWVSERKDVLSTLFWMLTLGAYVRWVRRPGRGRYAVVIALFALGLMAKPMLVTLPCVLLLLDWWPLRRVPVSPSRGQLARLVGEKVPLLLLAGLAAVTTVYAQRAGGAMVALDKIPPAARLANAAVSYLRYIGATLYPAGLSIFYPYRPWPPWMGWSAGLVLLALTALAVASARRRPYVVVGWLWYLVALLPVIGLVQVGAQAMADRFTYVPQVGLAIVVAWGAREALAGWRYRGAALGGSAAAIGLACVLVSARQVQYWRDTETLFAHALAVTRDNYLAHMSLGEALVRQGRFAEGRAHYLEALRLNPASPGAHLNVGNALLRDGRTAEAEAELREALRLQHDVPEAHNSLGLLLARSGRTDEAVAQYRAALEEKPYYAEPHVNLGNALRARGEFAAAAAEYRAALARHPEWADAHYGLAVSLGSLDDLASAEHEYRAAVEADPGMAEAHFGLGLMLQARGEMAGAVAALRDAVRLAPTWPVAGEALAWTLATRADATAGDAREAVALAEGARATAARDDPRLLDTLAAAYAADGRFVDAVAAARQAADLARADADERFAADVEKRLALYEGGRRAGSSERVAPQ